MIFGGPACRDFLGYYSALGLSPNGDGPSQQDIKQAFRKAALEWHPDRQQVVNADDNMVWQPAYLVTAVVREDV